ncbi:MAG TPA: siderophore-interacting protein [Pseudonocardiaceae bacterium]
MTGPGRGPGSSGGGRRRPPPLRAEVLRSARVTPNLVRVTVGGAALDSFNFPGPASHFKLMLPPPGQHEVDLPEPGEDGLVAFDRASPLVMRTYTARRFDRQARELDIEVVLHGDGPAAHWAADATPGSRIAVSSPRSSGFARPADARWLLLGGDTSAMPALATILEIGPGAATTCLIELSDPSEQINLPAPQGCKVEWLVRDPSAEPGSALLDRLRSAALPPTPGFVWIAAEASCIRAARRHLLTERGLDRHHVVTRGYWRAGAVNHPDHDFGDDQLG